MTLSIVRYVMRSLDRGPCKYIGKGLGMLLFVGLIFYKVVN